MKVFCVVATLEQAKENQEGEEIWVLLDTDESQGSKEKAGIS